MQILSNLTRKSPPTGRYWASNPHGNSLGPRCNRLRKTVTGRQHQGAPAPPPAPTASSFHVASHGGSSKAVACGSPWNIPYNRPFHGYKQKRRLPSHNTPHSRASLPPLVFFLLFLVVRARRSYLGELEQLESFGMNNIKSFLLYLLSYYQYIYAYEIQLSSYVISLA